MSLSCKTFEVRDRTTFVPCFGVLCGPEWPEPDGSLIDHQSHQTQQDAYLLRRAGYHTSRCVLLGRLDGGAAHYDPYDWGPNPRTMLVAHEYVTEHWDELKSGAVIDVEHVLGETSTPKQSENFEIIVRSYADSKCEECAGRPDVPSHVDVSAPHTDPIGVGSLQDCEMCKRYGRMSP